MNSKESHAVDVTVKDGVAKINAGRHRGWSVACGTTARMYVEGHQTRANIVDAISLSAGYLDAQEQIAKLKSELRKARSE